MPDPKGARPRTYSSFADPATNVIRAWVEPKNWVPQWSEPFKNDGCRYLLNGVRSFVMLRRPEFKARGRPEGSPWCFHDPPAALHENEIILFEEYGTLWGAYDPADAEGEAFVRKAFRIATKFTRDDFIECGRDTGRVVAREVRREHGYARCAPDAWRWLMARRHNYVATHHYWHKPSNYPVTEQDFAHLPPPVSPPPAAPKPTPPAPSRNPRRRRA